jgi:hypothetical protein
VIEIKFGTSVRRLSSSSVATDIEWALTSAAGASGGYFGQGMTLDVDAIGRLRLLLCTASLAFSRFHAV